MSDACNQGTDRNYQNTAARVSVRQRLELNLKANQERIDALEKLNKQIHKSLAILDANKNLEILAELFSVMGNNTY